eukprot:NODE_7421_length_478_cov_5.153846_g6977_i0.p1 GENE.NODE_7421_length_478_cov_5.153846_g6977_i0~~NODE_7421_length_478_cov_5.153846_g6977_i0.p1  ORF type:complete len:106 (-),score=17.87 NODE_7421_length_478_cov_5.153846_g6977_i0:101-418(-)
MQHISYTLILLSLQYLSSGSAVSLYMYLSSKEVPIPPLALLSCLYRLFQVQRWVMPLRLPQQRSNLIFFALPACIAYTATHFPDEEALPQFTIVLLGGAVYLTGT